MLSWMTFAAAGLAVPPFLPEVIDWRLLVGAAIAAGLMVKRQWRSAAVAFFLACGYSAHYCEQRFAQLPPAGDMPTKAVFDALILGPIEEQSGYGRVYYRFDIQLAAGQCAYGYCPAGRARYRVNYYGVRPPQAGTWARLTLRLRPPTGARSVGAFDYGQWLIANGYAGRGYAKAIMPIAGAEHAASIGVRYQQLRNRLLSQQREALVGLSRQGIMRALLYADRRDVSDEDWALLSRTGTSHLMAISGMHIGIVMAWGFVLARLLGAVLTRGGQGSVWLGPALGFALASAYAAMAGFTLPTQRALIMAAVLCVGLLLQRRISPWQGLQIALVLVLMRDPLALHSAGFYLSFIAVGVLLMLTMGVQSDQAAWRKLPLLQAQLLFVLLPVLAIWGFGSGVAALPANLVAIPALALVIMPVLFVALLAAWLGLPDFGLFSAANSLLKWLFNYLELLSQLPYWQPALSVLSILCLLLAAGLLLLPRGVLGRPLAVMFAGLALLQTPPSPPPGHVWVSVLDVGQGLSVLVQQGRRALIYDTGPSFSARYNSVDAVLLPLLRRRGIHRVDRLVLSHGDRDHAGAADRLVSAVPVKQVLSGEPERHRELAAKNCHFASPWLWDGVEYRFLRYSPSRDSKSNNRSCVLLIRAGDHRVLLTGDIERGIEAKLARNWPPEVALDMLLAAHHGSKSSSSDVFLRATQAEHVVFAASRFNTYGHPAKDVTERFQRLGSRCWQTGIHGSVHFEMTSEGMQLLRYDGKKRYFWQITPKDVCAVPYSGP
ncbi:DNA internalization-related competence protein ComEC/Rec2 [Spongiibacter marinus]|uniref:DNA internalization-related competence protein ComEC/Rec2 n=1 Tax=Spongiibacter marinus TaxID=354246 RepID=UPI003C48BCB3